MQEIYERPTTIKGLSEVRRLPRIGRIRLGVKVVPKTGGKEHPKEVDYFVVPPEVARVYGEKPKELDVMFPVEDLAVITPQSYEYYGSSKGLKCTGDGVYALEYNEETRGMDKRSCPCERLTTKKCSRRMHLRVILPRVNMGGIYQIDTASANSIIDINSGIQYVRCSTVSPEYPNGRLAFIPLRLLREPTKTKNPEDGTLQTHYTLRLRLDADLETLNKIRSDVRLVHPGISYALAAPVCENPEFDDGATVVTINGDEPGEASPAVDSEVKKSQNPPPSPSPTQSPKTKRLITDAVLPGLKELNAGEGERLEKLLMCRFGKSKLSELDHEQAKTLMDFINECREGVCELTWRDNIKSWDVCYPRGSKIPASVPDIPKEKIPF